MPANPGVGEYFPELHQQEQQLLALFRRPGIGRMSLLVQPAFVTDANAATIPRVAVGTHFQQLSVLRHSAVAADIEMIAHGAETTGLVVTEQLLGGIVTVAAGGATVEDKISHRFASLHHGTILHGEKLALVQHFLLTNHHRECFLYHGLK